MTSATTGSSRAWTSGRTMRYRSRLRRAQVEVRRATASHRMLPDFLIIGAMRGGTSSLYKYLGAHPLVAPSIRKETEFFTRFHDRGINWYRAHYPLRIAYEDLRRPLAFEATPYYLFHPLAPRRVADALPECKLIVMLRDPVARAWSHYRHMRKLGLETLSFEDAVAAEAGRLQGEEAAMASNPSYRAIAHHRFSYIARGRYAPNWNGGSNTSREPTS